MSWKAHRHILRRKPTTFGRHIEKRTNAAFSVIARPKRTVSTQSLLLAHSRPSMTLFSSSSPALVEHTGSEAQQTGVPMILLAGFLGSGKTSALKHLLENRDGIKVGVIVNDVASVNIDAKLLIDPAKQGGDDIAGKTTAIVELQNGCVCCSLADELMDNVAVLMDDGRRDLDAIVVELSGVADPVAVRSNWGEAKLRGHPVTKLANIDRVVTLIDACTFGTDWMTWSTAGDRQGWTEEEDDCAARRQVPELLAEQVEAADVLLVNKIDLAGTNQVQVASGVARGLNDNAVLHEVAFGQISPNEILGLRKEEQPCNDSNCADTASDCTNSNFEDAVVSQRNSCCEDANCAKSNSVDKVSDCAKSNSVDKVSDCANSKCADTNCKDPDCGSDSNVVKSQCCDDPKCNNSNSADTVSDCANSNCADPTCNDSNCAETTKKHKTSTESLGISTFVYKRTSPFHAQRLLGLLNKWPIPIKNELDLGQMQRAATEGFDDETQNSPFVGVIRSKGFCWLAPNAWDGSGEDSWRHDTAMYWSHAGKHFAITAAGKWWGSISLEQMKSYFVADDNLPEYERILRQDFVSDEWGDRRQELVFIGMGLNGEDISSVLDDCLMTEEELMEYRTEAQNYLNTFATSATRM